MPRLSALGAVVGDIPLILGVRLTGRDETQTLVLKPEATAP